jgi:integrase
MAYTIKNRPSLYADLRTEEGWWKCVGLPAKATPDGRKLAAKIEQMWETLAVDHRAWDVLGAVRERRLTIGRLYDWWIEVEREGLKPAERVPALRRRLNDIALGDLLEAFLVVYEHQVGPEQVKRARRHIEYLVAEGLTASKASPELLTARLYAFKGARNTLRVVHSSWTVFFEYARTVRDAVPTNPMANVARPPVQKHPPAFYELDTIERICDWQPTPQRRALFAFLYGTAIEISVALTLTRADVNPATKEVRAPGTKAHQRDRVVRVDDWAWARFWSYVRDLHPAVTLFAGLDRWKASDWHRQTVGDGEKLCHNQWRTTTRDGLKLGKRIKMYAARHAWAARHLRAGVPIEVVQRQLGHGSAKETLDTYGMFLPGAADRNHWQRQVAKAEKRRRSAQ